MKWPYAGLSLLLLALLVYDFVIMAQDGLSEYFNIGAGMAAFVQSPGMISAYWLGVSLLPVIKILALASGGCMLFCTVRQPATD